jgi:hypothetical protein
MARELLDLTAHEIDQTAHTKAILEKRATGANGRVFVPE